MNFHQLSEMAAGKRKRELFSGWTAETARPMHAQAKQNNANPKSWRELDVDVGSGPGVSPIKLWKIELSPFSTAGATRPVSIIISNSSLKNWVTGIWNVKCYGS